MREWPEIAPEVEAIVVRLCRAERIIERASVDTLEANGLAHGELQVLLKLTRGLRAHGDVARALLISTGTLTNRLDKLEKAGMVRRLPDPDDRRGVLVELTPEGRATLDRYIAVQARRERELMAAMSEEDRVELAGLLRKLLASLESRPVERT